MHATAGAVGALLAGGLAVAARRHGPRREAQIFGAGLAIAAAIYVAFAAARGAELRWAVIESAGLVVFGGLAWLGVARAPAWLVTGWLLHIGWDIGLHSAATPFVPFWYPPLCVGFDATVALWVAVRRRDLAPRASG